MQKNDNLYFKQNIEMDEIRWCVCENSKSNTLPKNETKTTSLIYTREKWCEMKANQI
jgi:hypothetical protein